MGLPSGGFQYLKAIIPFLLIVVNLLFWLVPLMVVAVIRLLLPLGRFKPAYARLMTTIYALAVAVDDRILWGLMGIQLVLRGEKDLSSDGWCLVLSNHRSWADIFILQHILAGKSPMIRFLVKRELLFMPIVGQICWALDYPFLSRHSRDAVRRPTPSRRGDLAVLRKNLLGALDTPASLVNFVEGSRYTNEKASRFPSPYLHLLRPKAGGLKIILPVLDGFLKSIFDVTIVYDPPDATFWGFLSGGCRRVIVDVRRIPLSDVPFPSSPLANLGADDITPWINALWVEKDHTIRKIWDEPS